MLTTLDKIVRQNSAVVVEIKASNCIQRRLSELGFVKGTIVEHVMNSPVGDPVCYRVRGSLIAMRKCDASNVFVETRIYRHFSE